MDAPQSRLEVDPVELLLRTIDDRLRIRWNPRSVVTRPGYFDVYGKAVGAQYDGRWEVHLDGKEESIYQLKWDGAGADAYRPVGEWLVEFMRKWDRANVHWMEEMKQMMEEEERLELAAASAVDEESRQFWDHAGFHIGGEELIGRGFGLGTATRFGK